MTRSKLNNLEQANVAKYEQFLNLQGMCKCIGVHIIL